MRKAFSIIFSLFLLFNIFTTDVYAASPTPRYTYVPDFNGDYFITAGRDTPESAKIMNAIDDGLGNGLVAILTMLYQVGDVIAICIFIFFGIRYLVATPQKKADLKASMYPYFVGLLLYIVGVPIAIVIINIFIKVF